MDLTDPRRALGGLASGTTLRFASLVAAVLGTATVGYQTLYQALPGVLGPQTVRYARCMEAYDHALPAVGVDWAAYQAANDQARRGLSRCLEPFERSMGQWILLGVVLLLAVALLFYLATPWWIRRRLVAVTPAAFPRLDAELSRLDGETTFLLDPRAPAPGGLAFGRRGRHAVRVNAGLVPLAVTDPALFRAIVRHELAHLRNRDVDLAYAVMALWRAFLVASLAPAVAVIVHVSITKGADGDMVLIAVRTLLLLLMVYLCRNAILRSRERYADARAAESGDTDGLRRAVGLAGEGPRWRRRFGVHPAVAGRLRAIDDPVGLLRPGFGELFGAGVSTMVAASSLLGFGGLVLPHTGDPAHRPLSWVMAPIVAGILATAAWRARILADARGGPVPVLGAAAGFGLGLLLGDVLSAANPIAQWTVFGSPVTDGQLPLGDARAVGGYSLGAGVLGALLLVGGVVCQAGVAAAGARAWLPLLRGRNAWWGWGAGVAVTAVPFALWFGIWWQIHSAPFLVGRLYSLGVDDPARVGVEVWRGPAIELVTLSYPPLILLRAQGFVVPVLALVWLYPLSARVLRRAHDGGVRLAATVALSSAGGFAVVLLGARAALRGFAPDLAGAANFSGYFYFSAIAGVTVLQAVTGWLVAARARAYGLILGQLAAFVLAVASTAVFVLSQAIGGCVPAFRLSWAGCGFPNGWSYAWGLLETILVQGALAALIGGAVGRLPRGRAVAVRRLTPVAAGLLLLVLAATAGRAVYGTGAPIARPQARDAGTLPAGGGPARPLSAEEARRVAGAALTGLPSIWRPTTPSGGDGVSGGGTSAPAPETTIEPPACRPFVGAAYLAAAPASSGSVSAGNGGKLASSTLLAAVRSYPEPVPASVLETAERDRIACPGFTATTDGFQIRCVVRPAPGPPLGEQSWRAASAMTSTVTSSSGTITVTGTTTTATVRAGHTLITLTMTSIGEPLDETIFLAALRRLVAALPA